MPTPGEHDDDEVVAFLRRKRAGEQISGDAHFHEADIYAADPSTLTAGFEAAAPGGSWFFFTHVRPKSSSDSRKSRLVGGGVGTWHSERAPRDVFDGEGNCVGHSQYFSYKRKTGKNCSERTEWYMVEFSDGQEADHERVHGGKPQLVLCKIYKAHSCSRSASVSSARKRKATDERIDQASASAPTKAKRRLFGSPAPAPAAASQSQELVSSRVWYQLAASLGNHPLQVQPLLSDAATSESHGMIGGTEPLLLSDTAAEELHGKIGGTSDFFRFWPEPEAASSSDWGFSMVSDVHVPPALKHCFGANASYVSDASATTLCGKDAWSSAFGTRNDTAMSVCSVPPAPTLPSAGSSWSWWSGAQDNWSY